MPVITLSFGLRKVSIITVNLPLTMSLYLQSIISRAAVRNGRGVLARNVHIENTIGNVCIDILFSTLNLRFEL